MRRKQINALKATGVGRGLADRLFVSTNQRTIWHLCVNVVFIQMISSVDMLYPQHYSPRQSLKTSTEVT